MSKDVPQILINREPLDSHSFNAELLGNCDGITQVLLQELGWLPQGDDEARAVAAAAQAALPPNTDSLFGHVRAHRGGHHVFAEPNR